ncbi:MAG: hypothetical protein JW850_04630 [Thermoflexales bacterium]|nr:hypothetical protein [Thermoflexales bacterium]
MYEFDRDLWNEEASLAGYMGLRAMEESAILEYLPVDEQESVELVSGPREGKAFVDIEDCPESASVFGLSDQQDSDDLFDEAEEYADRTWRKQKRDTFFARLEASQQMQSDLGAQANQAESKAELYAVLDDAAAFDGETPAWMFSAAQCQMWDLYPLKPMDELVMPVVERAERRIEADKTARRNAFFARLEASIAMQGQLVERTNTAVDKAGLYAVADEAVAFDNFTSLWMFSADDCQVYGLRPLKSMERLLDPAIGRAERKLERMACRFVPVKLEKNGGKAIAYTPAFLERKLKEGYRVVG